MNRGATTLNIKEFDYLEIALNELKNNKDDLLKASLNLENFFLELLNESYCEFSNNNYKQPASASFSTSERATTGETF